MRTGANGPSLGGPPTTETTNKFDGKNLTVNGAGCGGGDKANQSIQKENIFCVGCGGRVVQSTNEGQNCGQYEEQMGGMKKAEWKPGKEKKKKPTDDKKARKTMAPTRGRAADNSQTKEKAEVIV